MNKRFLTFFAWSLVLITAADATPYFVPEAEFKERQERGYFHAWPIVELKESIGFFDDEEKTFQNPSILMKEIKKIDAIRLDQNTRVPGRWVEITEASPIEISEVWF